MSDASLSSESPAGSPSHAPGEQSGALDATSEQLREYARRLEILREIDRAILTAEQPSDIARAALHRLREFVPFIRASVLLFHWDEEMSEILAVYRDHGDTELAESTTFPLDDIPVPAPLHDGDSVIVDDIRTAPATPITMRLRKEENVRSYVCFPLRVEGTLIGMANLGADQPGVYQGQWKHIIREVADQLAIAIHHAELVKQVKAYSEELETRVQERTAELEAFTYSVSHDLRTPLRAVAGFSRMLMERYGEVLDGEGKRLVQVIQDNANKMTRLIDGLLSLSRLDRQPLRRRVVDVESLVRRVFSDVVSSVDASSGSVQVDLRVEPLSQVEADPSMLQRLLVNVLSNAVKFSREETRPTVTVRSYTSETDETVFVIEDNGIGFDMDYVDKLFGVFERLHDESFEGTGVGLAIAKRVVERHGGRIWAEGHPGEGAQIFFTLAPQSTHDASSERR